MNLQNTLPYLPKYCISKFKPSEYMFKQKEAEKIYLWNAFNEYGDVMVHWDLPPVHFSPEPAFSGKFNDRMVRELEEFASEVRSKGASLFFSFPSFEERSFDNNKTQIAVIEKVLRKNFIVVSDPPVYRFSTEQMFNTPYHLSGKAVLSRTGQLIKDLKKVLVRA
jgi:hypothetical protein